MNKEGIDSNLLEWLDQLPIEALPPVIDLQDGRQIRDVKKWIASLKLEAQNPESPRHRYQATLADILEVKRILKEQRKS